MSAWAFSMNAALRYSVTYRHAYSGSNSHCNLSPQTTSSYRTIWHLVPLLYLAYRRPIILPFSPEFRTHAIMSILSKIIALGIVGVVLYLFADRMLKPAEAPSIAPKGEIETYDSSKAYLKKTDSSGITVQGFITSNLIRHVRKQGNQVWFQLLRRDYSYHLKDFYTECEEVRLTKADNENGIDFMLKISIRSGSYRIKKAGSEWSSWTPGYPHTLNGSQFLIQRTNGRFHWKTTDRVTPI